MKPEVAFALCLSALPLLFAAKGDLPSVQIDDVYFISSPQLKVLDVIYGNVKDDASVISYTAKGVDTLNQIWRLIPAPMNGYYIASKKDENFLLSAKLNAELSTINVVVHQKSDQYFQVWNIAQFQNNSLTFTITTGSGMYSLKYTGDTSKVVVVLNDPVNPNLWIFSKTNQVVASSPSSTCPCYPGSSPAADGITTGIVKSGLLYFIKNTLTSKVIDVTSGIGLNNNVVTLWWKKFPDSASNQIWKLTLQADGTNSKYKIATMLSGEYLLTDSTKSVVIFQDFQDSSQEWILEPADSGSYYIKTSEGKYLGFRNGQLEVNDNSYERWVFSEIYQQDPSNCPCAHVSVEVPCDAYEY